MESEKKLIFQIIHGSFVDGYGCRTTIFLKGCPLRCKWCCNPEGQNTFLEVKVNADHVCNNCGKCLEVCPTGAITIAKADSDEEREVSVDRDKCSHCGKCASVCLCGKLDVFGHAYSVDELVEILKRDEGHYLATGGGVTIGGGEATMHGEFCLELIRKLKENYIQTALDTCGYITDEAGLQAFDEADYVLFDIKGIDPERHKENTGVDNLLILENLERRNRLGKPAIIRVPVIPGYNDMPEELDAIAKYIAGIRVVERVDLIPYHDYCRVKYKQLGREYPIPPSTRPMTAEEELALLERFTKYGLNVQIGG